MKITLISDTHLRHRSHPIKIPPCDMVIHAGDALVSGDLGELDAFCEWFSELPVKHKIFVAGNHDMLFEKEPTVARHFLPSGIVYLEDSGVEIEGFRIWGSPWQPEFQNWAFNLPRGRRLEEKWALIPEDTDILVTHSPPMGILDLTDNGDRVGCADLRAAVERVNPKVHAFGHVHSGYGVKELGRTLFVNAAVCDVAYRPVHEPVLIEIGPDAVVRDVSEGRLHRKDGWKNLVNEHEGLW